jgi:hypothetical protein
MEFCQLFGRNARSKDNAKEFITRGLRVQVPCCLDSEETQEDLYGNYIPLDTLKKGRLHFRPFLRITLGPCLVIFWVHLHISLVSKISK